MKQKEWINGNKMKIETNHKTFNKQTNIITTGNVIANTQTSFYVRAFNDCKNAVNQTVDKYHLQNFDINQFHDMPKNVEHKVRKYADQLSGVIVYDFHHFTKYNRITHGYIVTTKDNYLIEIIPINNNEKSLNILNVCCDYITKYGG